MARHVADPRPFGRRAKRRARRDPPQSLWQALTDGLSRRGTFTLGILLPLAALAMVCIAPADIGPAVRARFGHGVAGSFLAQHESCDSRGGCDWYGTFTPDGAGVVRTDVLLASGGPSLVKGQRTSAIDTGDRAAVYPPGGGHDWIYVGAFLLVSAAYLAAWSLIVGGRTVGYLRSRRRSAEGFRSTAT